MDEQLIAAIENNIIGYAVLYGGEAESFLNEDGWTGEQIQNFADSVDGLVVPIVKVGGLS